MGPDHRNRTYRRALRPPSLFGDGCRSFCYPGRPLPASTVLPSLREPRAGYLSGSASLEMSRIAGETVHATFRFWDHTPNKRARYGAPGRTSSCRELCHHHSRTCCSETWPLLTPPTRKKNPALWLSRERTGPGRLFHLILTAGLGLCSPPAADIRDCGGGESTGGDWITDIAVGCFGIPSCPAERG
jgi:hypothetical protein